MAETDVDRRVADAIATSLHGKYVRKNPVGRGAYGEVWLVERVGDQLPFVAKVMQTEKQHRYESEVRCLQSCDHFSIVKLVDSLQSAVGPIIVLEFANGGDLSKFIKTRAATNDELNELEVGNIFLQLTLALHHIHTKRMMHRDIKTANVLLTSSGLVKMSDFGFSRQFDATVSQDVADTFLGTPYYLAPELWKRQKYSKKADIWSLGVVLYELMTLRRPFVSANMRGLMSAIVNADFQVPTPGRFSVGLIDVLVSMLNADPARRPSTAEILATPAMREIARTFSERVAVNGTIPGPLRELITDTVTTQMANLHVDAAVSDSLGSEDSQEDRIEIEGPVQIGSVKEWKPRYMSVLDSGLVVCRMKDDRKSQKLGFDTITKVGPPEPAAAGAEPVDPAVFVISLNTGYTVWVKLSSTEEATQWLAIIHAAMARRGGGA